jgi:aryl-alcohol dehydrogenase-like predicted oxidoreductase
MSLYIDLIASSGQQWFALSQGALATALVGVDSLAQLQDVLAAVQEGPLDQAILEGIDDRFYDLFLTA